MKAHLKKEDFSSMRNSVTYLDHVDDKFDITPKTGPTLELKLSDLTHCIAKPFEEDYSMKLVKHLDMTIKKLTKQSYYNSVKLPSCSHLAVYFVTDELQMLEVFQMLENNGYQFEMNSIYSPLILHCNPSQNYRSSIEEKLHLYTNKINHLIDHYLY